MAGRASIVGAAATHVGKVREHNEDAHFFDADLGVFIVCDGMGGHAAGEVASAIAIRTIRQKWSSHMVQQTCDGWLDQKTPEAKKQLFAVVRGGVIAAHDAILSEAARDEAKSGMGTTLVGAMIVGNDMVFAHAGDSRAYLVRDQISMQLTEDHTLLARLLAAGIDVDVSGEGSRFRSMLTNALGIGKEVKVSTFVVPLADGDRFLLCSDGISEYVKEEEVGEVLSKQPSPARAAQKLIEMALDRGGGDNATAVVVRVLEAGETPQSAEMRNRDERVIASCKLWGTRTTPQQRLRALRLANAREYGPGELLPANTMGDRVAWIIVDGEAVQNDGADEVGPGALVYPEALIADAPLPHREDLAVTRTDVRALALRADDFRELCEDDAELGEALLEALQPLLAARRARPVPERQSTDMEIAEAAARRLTEERDAVGAAPPPGPSLDEVLAGTRSIPPRDPRVVELDQILGHAPITPPAARGPRVREAMKAATPPDDDGEDEEEDTGEADAPLAADEPTDTIELGRAGPARDLSLEEDDDGAEVGYIVSAVPRDDDPNIHVSALHDADTSPRVPRAPAPQPQVQRPAPSPQSSRPVQQPAPSPSARPALPAAQPPSAQAPSARPGQPMSAQPVQPSPATRPAPATRTGPSPSAVESPSVRPGPSSVEAPATRPAPSPAVESPSMRPGPSSVESPATRPVPSVESPSMRPGPSPSAVESPAMRSGQPATQPTQPSPPATRTAPMPSPTRPAPQPPQPATRPATRKPPTDPPPLATESESASETTAEQVPVKPANGSRGVAATPPMGTRAVAPAPLTRTTAPGPVPAPAPPPTTLPVAAEPPRAVPTPAPSRPPTPLPLAAEPPRVAPTPAPSRPPTPLPVAAEPPRAAPGARPVVPPAGTRPTTPVAGIPALGKPANGPSVNGPPSAQTGPSGPKMPRPSTPIPPLPSLPSLPRLPGAVPPLAARPAARPAPSQTARPIGIVPQRPDSEPAPAPPARGFTGDEIEIEAFVEIEAEPPDHDEDTAVIELPGQGAHANETTGEINPPLPLKDDLDEEDTQSHLHAITSEEAVAVSGTINVPDVPRGTKSGQQRARRISEGWEDGD